MEEKTYINSGKFIYIFNEIESFLNLIITHHIEPKDKSFFVDYFLNTSVINFGAKIKILINLDIFSKSEIKKIRTLSSNRNVFAHTNRNKDFVESITEIPDTNNLIISVNDVIIKTNSEGKLIKLYYKEFIKEHTNLQNEIIDFISEYIIANEIYLRRKFVSNLQNLKK